MVKGLGPSMGGEMGGGLPCGTTVGKTRENNTSFSFWGTKVWGEEGKATVPSISLKDVGLAWFMGCR